MLSIVAASTLSANNAEVTTSNLRAGAAFDNIKASWSKAFNIGDFKSNLECKYDYAANKNFLKSASLSGNAVEGDDMSVSYEVEHSFGDDRTDVKLTAVAAGTTFSADYDTVDQLKEVSASRDVEIGDQKVGVAPSWLVKSKTARVKLMSAFSGNGLSAQVDYNTDGGSASYEVGLDRSLEDGRDISAKLRPSDKDLEIEYVDNKFEDGATWTATANVPVDDAGSMLDSAKLSLKRKWSW